MNSAEVLTAKELAIGYTSAQLIADQISFSVSKGDFCFILGANGSGKSTLLKTILGTLKPISGQLILNSCLESRALIGYVPQRTELNPSVPTTVREFVSLGLVAADSTRVSNEYQEMWLERLGLAELRNSSYWRLSGGQKQRASLVRALVRKPELLILDEPLSGLDSNMRESVLASLAERNRMDGMTILFVSHNLSTVRRYASKVLLLARNTVLGGAIDTVEKLPEFQDFLGFIDQDNREVVK